MAQTRAQLSLEDLEAGILQRHLKIKRDQTLVFDHEHAATPELGLWGDTGAHRMLRDGRGCW